MRLDRQSRTVSAASAYFIDANGFRLLNALSTRGDSALNMRSHLCFQKGLFTMLSHTSTFAGRLSSILPRRSRGAMITQSHSAARARTSGAANTLSVMPP